jgi:S-adenosylmethionine-diacylglycerol 3-amino-3-carboxypropyl transferase
MTTPRSPESTATDAQVQLSELVFTLSWEDSALDRAAFALRPGAVVATVGSGGCNALTFLLDDPGRALAFDYNPTQVWVLELKAAAFRRLDHGELLELFGVRPSRRRAALLASLADDISPEGRSYFQGCDWLVEHGLLGGGRYERFVRAFQVLLRAIHGRRRIEELFEDRDAAGRAAFFEDRWNTWAWRLLFKAFFNKTVLSRRGLSADYFVFDDGSRSFAESFANRTAHALRDLPVRDNPFLARYLLGRFLDENHLPEYLQEDRFDLVRARVERLRVVHGDIRDVFDDVEPASFDAICLSNVFELMSEVETAQALAKVARALRPGGTVTLRNLMVPRAVPPALAETLVLESALSRALHAQDRSFVYSSFQVYRRAGGGN